MKKYFHHQIYSVIRLSLGDLMFGAFMTSEPVRKMDALCPSRYFIRSGMKKTVDTVRKVRRFPPEEGKILDQAPLVLVDEA